MIQKAKHHLRVWQRTARHLASRRRFAKKKNKEISGWYCQKTCQPIIKPSGQEDIFNNKIHNINLVVQKINFLGIQPGEVFSFWHQVKKPTEKRGFKSASIFINNKMDRDVGGGLCQISTGLYSAALHFGCKIIERHSHSIDAYGEGRYFQLGQDATITFPHLDLQFENSFSYPIVISCKIEANMMIIIFHCEKKPCETKVDSKISKIIPYKTSYIKNSSSAKKIIQEGSDGKIVDTSRQIKFSDGKRITEFISTDYYKPMPKIVANN